METTKLIPNGTFVLLNENRVVGTILLGRITGLSKYQDEHRTVYDVQTCRGGRTWNLSNDSFDVLTDEEAVLWKLSN